MSVRRIAGRSRRWGLPQLLASLAAIAVGLHLYGLYRPSGPSAVAWFPYADKVQHLIGFGVPVALIILALQYPSRRRPDPRRSWAVPVVLAVFLAHGVLSEIAQHYFYTSRTGDPVDVLADWLGVLLGWSVAGLVIRDRRAQVRRGGNATVAQVQQ